jgi:hypothetical protein
MWHGKISGFMNRSHFNDFGLVLESIAEKDDTFRFSKEDFSYIVMHEDRNVVHRRCTWLLSKTDKSGKLSYRVVLS